MPKLVLYQQKRVDGGVRTGIELDDATIASRFDEGRGPPEPALLWYVDIRCEGRRIPSDPSHAIAWLLKNADAFTTALDDGARKFNTGIDGNAWPLRLPVQGLPSGTHGEIACSSMRRVSGRELTRVLHTLSNSWDELIRSVETARVSNAETCARHQYPPELLESSATRP
ncbi:MAG TPA: hypothetical protein VHQ47_01005 [Phycisphaerae bacterium]|nr:hypothetical protein [Phycisphaerae bacterium]